MDDDLRYQRIERDYLDPRLHTEGFEVHGLPIGPEDIVRDGRTDMSDETKSKRVLEPCEVNEIDYSWGDGARGQDGSECVADLCESHEELRRQLAAAKERIAEAERGEVKALQELRTLRADNDRLRGELHAEGYLRDELEGFKAEIERLRTIVDKRPTAEAFQHHYQCEWDTDAFMGWPEMLLYMKQLGMLKESDSTREAAQADEAKD